MLNVSPSGPTAGQARARLVSTASANAMSQSWPMICSTPVPSPCGQARTARSRIASSRRRRAASASTWTTRRWIWDRQPRGDRPCHGPSASATLASTSASTARAPASSSSAVSSARTSARARSIRPASTAASVSGSTDDQAGGQLHQPLRGRLGDPERHLQLVDDRGVGQLLLRRDAPPRSTPASSSAGCRGAVGGQRGHQPQLLHLDRGDPPDRRAQPHDPAHRSAGSGAGGCAGPIAGPRSRSSCLDMAANLRATTDSSADRIGPEPLYPQGILDFSSRSLWTTTRSAAASTGPALAPDYPQVEAFAGDRSTASESGDARCPTRTSRLTSSSSGWASVARRSPASSPRPGSPSSASSASWSVASAPTGAASPAR